MRNAKFTVILLLFVFINTLLISSIPMIKNYYSVYEIFYDFGDNIDIQKKIAKNSRKYGSYITHAAVDGRLHPIYEQDGVTTITYKSELDPSLDATLLPKVSHHILKGTYTEDQVERIFKGYIYSSTITYKGLDGAIHYKKISDEEVIQRMDPLEIRRYLISDPTFLNSKRTSLKGLSHFMN